MLEYDRWNRKKQNINASNVNTLYFKEREIWWCSIGINIGYEENGKGEFFNRPVLILKKYGPQVFMGIPISSTQKTGSFYHHIKFNKQQSSCLLTQLRLFDTRRLTQKVETLNNNDFQKIRKAVKELL